MAMHYPNKKPIEKLIRSIFWAGCCGFALAAVPAYAEGDDWEVDFGTDGIVVGSPGEDVLLNFGGRVHLDAVTFDNNITEFDDNVDIRRLRLGVTGTVYNDWRFKIEGDVGGVSTGLKNVWASYRGIKNVEVKGGNFVAPFSMEEMMSSNEISTMERSLASALSPGFLVGGALKTYGDRWTATGGYFFNPLSSNSRNDNDSGESLIVARGTFAPIRQKESVLHIGAAVERRSIDDGIGSRVRSYPEVGIANARLIDTRTLSEIGNYTNVGLEAAYMQGPVTLTGQYIVRMNDAPALGDPSFNGGYLQAAWVITGERRRYSTSSGVFGGVRPHSKFGAVEFVGRYSRLDLTDGTVTGGEEENLLAGINWYIGRNARLMTNFIHAKALPNRAGENESTNILQGRAQLNF